MILHIKKNKVNSVVNNPNKKEIIKLWGSTEVFPLSLTAIQLRPQLTHTQALWIKQCLIHVVFVYQGTVCLREKTQSSAEM